MPSLFRAVPDVFDVIIREFGRPRAEEIFGVGRPTINQWLIARGKRQLVRDRAEYVRFKRNAVRRRIPTDGASYGLPT